MVKRHLVRSFIIGIGAVSVMASTASAFSYKMNAMCFMQNGGAPTKFNPTDKEIKDADSSYIDHTPTEVTDQDVQTKYRIASVSKVLTTHWAMHILGPDYRFKTKLSITPTNQNKTCNVHFSGDMDIFMGKEMLSTVFQQLKPLLANQKCQKIAQLSYDEKFVVPFYSKSNLFIMQHRDEAGFKGSDPDLLYGVKTTKKALTYFTSHFTSVPVLGVEHVLSTDFENYSKTTPLKTYSFQSRPLYMMVREYNAYSSNVPPNILFEKLGGAAAYKIFIQNRLGLTTDSVEMYNGSGYPITTAENKSYNEVSCAAIVRIIQDMDQLLKSHHGSKSFQLADVMAVGGNGEVYSTFKNLYASDRFHNTLTAKTGSADRAITFGGMLNTSEGPLYFAVLTEPDSYIPDQLKKPRTYIRDLVSILSERFVLRRFNYTHVGLMNPIDSESRLVDDNGSISTRLN